jgi:hypothetical protein
MTESVVEARLRRFLLIVVEVLCVGTVAELWLAKHTKEPLQFVPFVLCAIGFVATLAVLLRPQRVTVLALRAVMIMIVAGSALGVYEHLVSNVDFEAEMRPGAGIMDVIMPALQGTAPLLAPGILALSGVLAIAATYYHPALRRNAQSSVLATRVNARINP